MIKRVQIKNFKSIKNLDVEFNRNLFVLAGQNESGKSSILEAIHTFYWDSLDIDTVNFELQIGGNTTQEIEITFEIEDSKKFVNNLHYRIENNLVGINDLQFSTAVIDKFDTISIRKTFDHKTNNIHSTLIGNSKNLLKTTFEHMADDPSYEGDQSPPSYLYPLVETNEEDIIKLIMEEMPELVFFNESSEILPDRILISDLESENTAANGYNAVMSLQKIANANFLELSKIQKHLIRNASIDGHSDEISITFQKDWKQKIHGDNSVKIKFAIEMENIDGTPTQSVLFYVETKDKEAIEPRKRSKGLVWFLSNWLAVKAKSQEKRLLLLYDEPGLYLHLKAHEDILSLFKRLNSNGHQIVYSTHSPTLIDLDSLDNIGLVLNSKAKGTTVEGLTSASFGSPTKKDALQPIANAMGLEPIKEFTVFGSKKSVIVEGISDFWYFKGMAELMGLDLDYKFVPAVGILESQAKPLISFCLGYDLNWLLVMDNGTNPQKLQIDLSNYLFAGDKPKTDAKIHLVPFKEIEDIFTEADLKLVDPKIKAKVGQLGSAMIGSSNKALFSRLFMNKVKDKKITLAEFDPKTIAAFKDVFDWIEASFKI